MAARYLTFAFSFMLIGGVHADHYSGATITTRCLSGNFHEVTLQIFRDCSGVPLNPQTLHLLNDCGVEFEQALGAPHSVEEVSMLCDAAMLNSTCNGGSLIGIELVTFKITVYLSSCENWRISWDLCCRGSSLNAVGNPGLYVETVLGNAAGECSASPVFNQDVIPVVCIGQEVDIDAGAVSTSSHRLSYHLIEARFASPAPTPIVYANGFSGQAPFTGMVIDTITGVISLLPTTAGSIITAVEVREFDGEEMIGTIMRDLLIIATNCSNNIPPVSSGALASSTGAASIVDDRSLRVCGDGAFCASMSYADTDADQSLSVSSDVSNRLPGATLNVTADTNPLQAQLCWDATNIAPGTYHFGVTVTDNACSTFGMQHYAYTVIIGEGPDAGSDGELQICENGNAIQLFGELAGTPDPGGVWYDPLDDSTSGIFTPGTSTAGDYTYLVTAPNGCTASSTVTVETLSSTLPECLNASVQEPTLSWIMCTADMNGTGRVRISSQRTVDLAWEVFLADGRVVLQGRSLVNAGSPLLIDVGRYTQGICLIRLTDREQGTARTARLVLP